MHLLARVQVAEDGRDACRSGYSLAMNVEDLIAGGESGEVGRSAENDGVYRHRTGAHLTGALKPTPRYAEAPGNGPPRHTGALHFEPQHRIQLTAAQLKRERP